MEVHQLRYFVAVVEHESFTRAAAACHVAQPSLSQQIGKLEDELGQPLFDRLGRQVRLTGAGQRLYRHASSILTAIEDARDDLAESAAGRGSLAVGAILTVAPYLVPPLVRAFLAACPLADLSIREDLTERLLAAILDGDLDTAIVALPIDDSRLEVVPIFREPLWLAAPAGHPLAARDSVSMADLDREPFILLDPIHCLGDQIVSFCKGTECAPRIVCRTSQLLTVQELVALGLGVSLVPRLACLPDPAGRVRYRPLAGPEPSRTLAVVRHARRHRSMLCQAFIDIARNHAP